MTKLIGAILCVGVFLVLGIPGVVAGRRARAKHGPDHKMYYPVGNWRLRSKVVSATAVVRMGWAFIAVAPFMIIPVYGWNTLSPWAIARRADSACRHMIPESTAEYLAGGPVEVSVLYDDGVRCSAWFKRPVPGDHRLREFLTVDVRPGIGNMKGEAEVVRESRRLAEEGWTVERLPGFERAFIARAPADAPYRHPVIYIEHGDLIVELGFDPDVIDDEGMHTALGVLQTHTDLLLSYGR